MKKVSKNVIVFVVVLVLFLGGIVPKEVAFASTKSNISIKEKRKIELLCEEFRDFSGYYCLLQN